MSLTSADPAIRPASGPARDGAASTCCRRTHGRAAAHHAALPVQAHRSAADATLAHDAARPGSTPVSMPLGTVVGRLEGTDPAAPAILIGSHIDTVVDAGRYRRQARASCSASWWSRRCARGGSRSPVPIEILAFGDEENVRFPDQPLDLRTPCRAATIPAWLDGRDRGRHCACATPSWPSAAIRRASPPSSADRSAAAAISRFISSRDRCSRPRPCPSASSRPSTASPGSAHVVTGEAGHAGTVPMACAATRSRPSPR